MQLETFQSSLKIKRCPGKEIMRIIAGTARGRRLQAPPGTQTRPTADRVREAIFSTLAPYLAEARVLDAFAGSGALALEAISRGADLAWLVEKERKAAAVCAHNISLLKPENCRLFTDDVLRLLPRLRSAGESMRFDLVFADPPYNRGLLPALLDCLLAGEWLAPDGLVIAETTATASEFAPAAPWRVIKTSRYGDTAGYYAIVA
jgi:16S rRNA (guanine(966)-N(2))-methyltransferase RsmD